MKKMILAAAAALFSLSATAAELSFNNFEVRYSQLDFSCGSDCDGFGLKGSVEFNELFHGELDYSRYSGGGDSASLAYLGFGARHQFNDQAAVYGLLGAVRADVGDFDKTYGFAGVGVRGMLTENFEGEALLRKVLKGGFDPSLKLSGTYFFTETVGAQLAIETSDGDTGGDIGLRINF